MFRSALLDDQALHGAAEIAVHVGQFRLRQAGAIPPDPALRIEQDPRRPGLVSA
jgi:hypothetical protein